MIDKSTLLLFVKACFQIGMKGTKGRSNDPYLWLLFLMDTFHKMLDFLQFSPNLKHLLISVV
jgi:hypothetical protein